MNEDMKKAWAEITQMLGETTKEELDVFLRTWQRAVEAAKRQAVAETPPRQPLTDEEIFALRDAYAGHLRWGVKDFARAIEAKHGITGEQK